MAEEQVQEGHYVQVHYTGTFPGGEVFDSSEGKEPLGVLAGKGMLIKGFDQALIGMKPGEEKELDIASADGYGEHREELIREVPKEEVGGDITPEVGMTLGIRAPTGQVFPATITEVTDTTIKLDANHPLAGKDLHFKIKIESTREPTDEDMKQFMPQGHDHSHEGGCCGGGSCSDEEGKEGDSCCSSEAKESEEGSCCSSEEKTSCCDSEKESCDSEKDCSDEKKSCSNPNCDGNCTCGKKEDHKCC